MVVVVGHHQPRKELHSMAISTYAKIDLPFNGNERIAAVIGPGGRPCYTRQVLARLDTTRLGTTGGEAAAELAHSSRL